MGCCGSTEPLSLRLERMVRDHRLFLLYIVNKSAFARREASRELDEVVTEAMQEYEASHRHRGRALSPEARFVQHVHMLMPLQYAKDMAHVGATGRWTEDRVRFHAMVLRQLDTARKMCILGAVRAARQGMVAKYIRFLTLAKVEKGKTIVVPTLAIDAVWHAHMSFPADYRADTIRMCGFVLDHSDEIPAEDLERLRSETRRAWNARFAGRGDDYDQPLVVQLVASRGDDNAPGTSPPVASCLAPARVTVAIPAATCGVGGCAAVPPAVASCGGTAPTRTRASRHATASQHDASLVGRVAVGMGALVVAGAE